MNPFDVYNLEVRSVDASALNKFKQMNHALEEYLTNQCGAQSDFKVSVALHDAGILGWRLKIVITQSKINRFVKKASITLQTDTRDIDQLGKIISPHIKKFKRGRTKLWKRNPLKDF